MGNFASIKNKNGTRSAIVRVRTDAGQEKPLVGAREYPDEGNNLGFVGMDDEGNEAFTDLIACAGCGARGAVLTTIPQVELDGAYDWRLVVTQRRDASKRAHVLDLCDDCRARGRA